MLGGHNCKSLGKLSNWHQLWFTSADSSGNGHRLKTSRPSIPQGHLGGGLRGHTFKSLGNLSNGWSDWHQIWYTSADSSGNGHLYINLRRSRDCLCVSVAAGRPAAFVCLCHRAVSFTYFWKCYAVHINTSSLQRKCTSQETLYTWK